jgi:hypothetical protein
MFIQIILLATGDTSLRKETKPMATAALNRDVVLAIAEEVANGVQTAVDCWMTEIDLALTDNRLTTLGRLNAVREIVENYKHLTGQVRLDCRTLPALGSS